MSIRRSVTPPRRTSVHRLGGLRLLAGAVVGALLLTGCVSAAKPKIVPPTTLSSHTDEQVAPELEPYYKQDVSWAPCLDPGMQCADLIAPVDWANPGGERITLAIAKRPAESGKARGSMLINPGGPGGSGIEFLRGLQGSKGVMSDYDVVGFDPRGVGESTPIVCFTDDRDRDRMLSGTFLDPYGSAGWEKELDTRQKAWVDACVKNTGPLLAHIDTASVSRDLDMMRAVLGDDKLNYLGISFGTYIGSVYAALFPAKVGRMVLDGAVEPPYGSFESSVRQAAGFDRAFAAYLTKCLKSADCPVQGPLAKAKKQAHDLILSVDRTKLKASDGRLLDSSTVVDAIAYNLYAEFSWNTVTEVLRAVKKGDAGPVFEQADSSNERLPDGEYFGRLMDVLVAVGCAEPTRDDSPGFQEGIDRISKAAPVLGSIGVYDNFAASEKACAHWPYPKPTETLDFTAPGAAPILVLGTTGDPATPYSQAVALSKLLSSGVLVTHKGEGHGAYGRGVGCIDGIVDDYFVRGKVPASQPTC